MKLSFSTKGWHEYTWPELCVMAAEYGFDGIELHNIRDGILTAPDGPVNPERRNANLQLLRQNGISISCINTICDISDDSIIDASIAEIKATVDLAADLNVPYVRLHTSENSVKPEAWENSSVMQIINSVLPHARENNIILIIETFGMFADTAVLREVLDYYACDTLAALWDVQHPYRRFGEEPDATIKNLGAYVKHVHIKDSIITDGKMEYCLIGEGDLPLSVMMNALRSVNYEGFVSLEIDPVWVEELGAAEIVFPHFVNSIERFIRAQRSQHHLYHNKRGTGKYVWKKEILIEMTFSQLLDRMVEEFPDQYAFKYFTLDYTRTYSQFRDDVDTCARALIAMGVKPGDKVSVWASNVPQWFITFWATTKIGAILVTVNTSYKIHEAEYLFRQSDTHTLVLTEGSKDCNYGDIVQELCPELKNHTAGEPLSAKRLPFLRNVITVGFEMPGCLTWDQAIARHSEIPVEEVRRRAANVSIHDVANMQYTSGTTGFPKGVMLTHYNIVNNGKCIGDRMDLSTADRMMIHVPMFHCFGMVLAMTASMTHGATLLPLPYFNPKTSLACINQERITAFHGVPTMFIAMLGHEDFDKTDFSYMRTGIMAGSPCPITAMKDVVNKMNMKEITIVYGQTEASPGCTMSSTDDPLEVRVATVGRPLPEIECKIVDPETGEDLPDNVNGEFVARGYNIMKGYYKMPRETAAAIDADGWLHTGDLACRTPEGNFRITGRLKDMIIRGGENIYPKEIEEFIYTHPKVSDVQVIGVPDKQYGEEIMACIILKPDEEMTVEEMKKYVLDHMARHKVPKYIDFVDFFPTNAAGKILKYKMREQAVEKLNLQAARDIETA
ncbi:MAG: AMP-dependent synthetase [Ruminococcaceae bacterium]|nr:AMP-dependent synthetase [Oscillospiraceae bacterium]